VEIDPHGELSRVLAPVAPADFAANYWERAPLHVARDDAAYFAGIYGVADVEDALETGARDLERFALVRAGVPQAPLDAYVVTRPAIRGKLTGKAPEAHVDARKVLALFERGYTLVINDAALLSPRLQRACNRLQRDLGAYAGANVYFTPSGAQGLAVHHDAHDTLTVQIEGSKTWRIYEPAVTLPLESQPLHGGTGVPPLTPHRDITLAAGDTLYLPRGYVHEAIAAGERALHVTFALAPVRAIDLLHATLELQAEDNVALRRALPLGWQHDDAFAATFAATLAAEVPGLFAAPAIEAGARAALHDQFAASRGSAAGLFARSSHAASLTPQTLLSISPEGAFLLRERPAELELLLPGTALALPAGCAGAFTQLLAGPVRFGDLDLPLSETDRALFVKTLVREGVVVIGEP
jgi:lysine-specific demethylase/histidyl-hydroxylase NO66